jgi:hypothetical protein
MLKRQCGRCRLERATGASTCAEPTIQQQIGGVTKRAWDWGGHQAARHLWKKYATAADAFCFWSMRPITTGWLRLKR